ncbi:hypothetical protein [Tissierella sp. Yu-01]|uniref:hypothetical protein n=1 Tax=Tissierella sp. Yu-01 TaxID=3035694 RepID=UPI00240DDB07|nr:hypothetical protein [Tissierella sp. Yu-01]WFA08727.1 hypothetical protein P3962_13520 [Tissierella sp. Yu-01]
MKTLLNKILNIFIILILLSIVAPTPITNEVSSEKLYMNNEFENIIDTTRIINSEDYSFSQRDINYIDEGRFFVRRIDFNSNDGYYTSSFLIPGDNGELKYFDKEKNLISEELTDGALPLDTIIMIKTDRYNIILSQAFSYMDLGYGTKHSQEKIVPVSIIKEDGYWKVTYRFKNRQGSHGIMWGVGSSKELVNLNKESQLNLWANYDLIDKDRLGEDGYYYMSPSSYIPYTETSFLRNPSMYVVQSWIHTGGSLAADILGRSYLLIGLDNINDEGFIPTLPESNWLKTDYDIGPGFFDTRFNADMGDTYLKAYKKFGYVEFKDAYLKLSNYYANHIMNNHYKLYDKEGNEGWLVEDYSYDKPHKETHVSLNHQVFAINWFLKMYELDLNNNYEEIALKMLKGVKVTTDDWIMDDNNLHYAYLSDGTFGLNDYPTLTYNDLFVLQNTLFKLYGYRDWDLDILMNAKKIWMIENGIVDYKQ